MYGEYVVTSDQEASVKINGNYQKTLALDFSSADADVDTNYDTNYQQITNVNQNITNTSGQGLAKFFEGGGVETLVTFVAVGGGVILLVWAFIKRSRRRRA